MFENDGRGKKEGGKSLLQNTKFLSLKLFLLKKKEQSLFGKMKGKGHIKGDIIQPIDEVWNADL